jgi:hypothetical protein
MKKLFHALHVRWMSSMYNQAMMQQEEPMSKKSPPTGPHTPFMKEYVSQRNQQQHNTGVHIMRLHTAQRLGHKLSPQQNQLFLSKAADHP